MERPLSLSELGRRKGEFGVNASELYLWERASALDGIGTKASGCPSNPEGLSHRKTLWASKEKEG